jgi:quercetin dioxygenase-like cupin family protein
MKLLSLFALFLALSPSLAFASKPSNASLIEAKDLKWADVAGFPGVQTAVVEGDAAKGSHHAFMKFAPGFAAPLHHHTANHFVTVVSGTLVLNVDGQEHRLPPGSYFAFKNKAKHTTSCAEGAECVLFVDVRGKWDVMPEKTEKTEKN